MHRSLPTTGILATALAALTFAAGGSAREAFPTVVPLPDGFQPEGIATGYGPELFAGSLATALSTGPTCGRAQGRCSSRAKPVEWRSA